MPDRRALNRPLRPPKSTLLSSSTDYFGRVSSSPCRGEETTMPIPTGSGGTNGRGLPPFSTDLKLRHGSPDTVRDTAFAETAPRTQGAAMASGPLNV